VRRVTSDVGGRAASRSLVAELEPAIRRSEGAAKGIAEREGRREEGRWDDMAVERVVGVVVCVIRVSSLGSDGTIREANLVVMIG
jgi:hypothetical protein